MLELLSGSSTDKDINERLQILKATTSWTKVFTIIKDHGQLLCVTINHVINLMHGAKQHPT